MDKHTIYWIGGAVAVLGVGGYLLWKHEQSQQKLPAGTVVPVSNTQTAPSQQQPAQQSTQASQTVNNQPSQQPSATTAPSQQQSAQQPTQQSSQPAPQPQVLVNQQISIAPGLDKVLAQFTTDDNHVYLLYIQNPSIPQNTQSYSLIGFFDVSKPYYGAPYSIAYGWSWNIGGPAIVYRDAFWSPYRAVQKGALQAITLALIPTNGILVPFYAPGIVQPAQLSSMTPFPVQPVDNYPTQAYAQDAAKGNPMRTGDTIQVYAQNTYQPSGSLSASVQALSVPKSALGNIDFSSLQQTNITNPTPAGPVPPTPGPVQVVLQPLPINQPNYLLAHLQWQPVSGATSYHGIRTGGIGDSNNVPFGLGIGNDTVVTGKPVSYQIVACNQYGCSQPGPVTSIPNAQPGTYGSM